MVEQQEYYSLLQLSPMVLAEMAFLFRFAGMVGSEFRLPDIWTQITGYGLVRVKNDNASSHLITAYYGVIFITLQELLIKFTDYSFIKFGI